MDINHRQNTSGRFELSIQDERAQNRNGTYAGTSSNENQLSWKVWKFRRNIVTFMGFLGFFTIYALKVSLSVAIVAMTQKVNVTFENNTTVEEQEFNWDSTEQGLLLSSFSYGYIWTQFLGGILAAKYGGHIVFGIGIALSSIITVLSPFAAKLGLYPLISIRILLGLFEGVSYPSIQDVYAHWAPIYERTIMSGIVHMGSHTGTFASFLLSGHFAQHFGWESIFYIFGGIGCLWFIVWITFIKRDPGSDSRISLEERTYIESNLDRRNPNNGRRPWKAIFSSPAVYALMTTDFCDAWTNYTFISEIPTFLNDVLKYNLGTTGMLAAAPYLVYIIVAVVVSTLSDYIRSKKILTTQKVRKITIASGFVISGSFLILMSNLENSVGVFICLIIAVSATALTRTYFSNPLDIAPNHASIVMGISNTVGVIAGTLAPMTAGFIAQNGTQDEWRVIFYIAVGFCIIGSVVFAIFGKGSIQKWAESDTSSLPKCSEAIEASKVTQACATVSPK